MEENVLFTERLQPANGTRVQDAEVIDENHGSTNPGVSPERRLSRFAQVLGFGLFRGETASPVNMGTIEHDDEDSFTHNFRNTPLEPSFYQIGMRMADTQWAMNYQEAAIYLEEGANNDQFSTHPKRKESLPAYILAHTSWFYLLDMGASLLLLLLAIAEPPAIDALQVPIAVHASLELGALAVLIFELFLKLRWLGFKTLFSHHRTALKATTLTVMVVEAVVVLVRQSSHFRVTRALRPIFLVDNRYCRGVRRFVRQVLQSLPPILDMMVLLFFFVFIFTLLGHFIFGHDTDDPFFSSVDESFINMFVLLTTANYPDVMMPAYSRNPWSVLFFAAYLVAVLYLFMNLLLAVVYDTFTTLEKEKFRKLVIHKRKACHFAFNLLVSKSNTNGIIFRHFYGLMTQYAPRKSLRDIYLIFRALNKANDGVISREEFCRFYEVAHLKWKPMTPGFQKSWPVFEKVGVHVQRFLNSQYADLIFNAIIVLNTVAMLVRWVENQPDLASWDAYIIAFCFSVEISLKITTWGLPRILASGWHVFDFATSLLFILTIIFVKFVPGWNEIMTFVRPLRLLRLFKLKKRVLQWNFLGILLRRCRKPVVCSALLLKQLRELIFQRRDTVRINCSKQLYKHAMDKRTENKMLRTEVALSAEEVDFIYRQSAEDPRKRMQILQNCNEDLASKGFVTYVGFRRRTKEILFKRMFRTEIPDWLRETEPILQISH
ncbi:unnamed protein product [Allacma fusca]|uniref:EF-hand domain-containing protein n=1 Tax=Allacma fusca TaxID=39272 RepID=A0A8J2KMW3_9HEXA|nr:unnamed protein product [Allacma fusca]